MAAREEVLTLRTKIAQHEKQLNSLKHMLVAALLVEPAKVRQEAKHSHSVRFQGLPLPRKTSELGLRWADS